LLYYDEGSTAAREIIQNYEFFHLHTTKNGDIIPSKIPKFQVLLVNYELFVNDFEILKKIPFQHIILDEAHRLKNKRSNTTKILSLLPCCRKTLLTGTPIQNNTKELYTLLNFIEPHNFPSEEQF
jgi:SWI/SNF-related matrix-associated actin-dependent regulator of chromatin subfamily A member 5